MVQSQFLTYRKGNNMININLRIAGTDTQTDIKATYCEYMGDRVEYCPVDSDKHVELEIIDGYILYDECHYDFMTITSEKT